MIARQEVWVAEDDSDGALLGFAGLDGDLLGFLYVDPASQGHGVGSALLAHVRARRPDGFRFWVFQRNERARRFYERNGCRVVELTDGSGNEEREPDALYSGARDAGPPPRYRRVVKLSDRWKKWWAPAQWREADHPLTEAERKQQHPPDAPDAFVDPQHGIEAARATTGSTSTRDLRKP